MKIVYNQAVFGVVGGFRIVITKKWVRENYLIKISAMSALVFKFWIFFTYNQKLLFRVLTFVRVLKIFEITVEIEIEHNFLVKVQHYNYFKKKLTGSQDFIFLHFVIPILKTNSKSCLRVEKCFLLFF